MVAAQCRLQDFQFPGGQAREFVEFALDDHLVQIEPSLWPKSHENGNIRGIGQRLSPNSVFIPGNREHRDRVQNRRSPLLAGISGIVRGAFTERRTAWLGREDSNLRMVESKSTALPLGDAPTAGSEKRRGGPLANSSGRAGL